MIEHCASEYLEKVKKKEQAYYIADCLKSINKILANHFGGEYFNTGLRDMLDPQKEDTRSGDDIARDIIKRAGLKPKKGGAANASV